MRDAEKSNDQIIQALRNGGYKATPQRIAICRFALSSKEHPSAQKVYSEVKKFHPTVSLATVYKTLQILKELGMLQELSSSLSQTRFDPNVKLHINLVCLQCGTITDVDDPVGKELIRRLAGSAEFTVTKHHLDVYGVCRKCKPQTARNQ
jgi:Fur family peroxide stress response transcriptional regulator